MQRPLLTPSLAVQFEWEFLNVYVNSAGSASVNAAQEFIL